ncbi:MAG: hypothetical protein M3O15_06450 [Acidobacteriota bacterium]|nr:hypothetical protein [Acidobacteriota bacterium]
MDCRPVRERLCDGRHRLAEIDGIAGIDERAEMGEEVAAHLADCPRCSAFARRLAVVWTVLEEGNTVGAEPGPAFSARVVARLPRSGELLAWAAVRALPAALVFALVLAGFGLSHPEPGFATSLLADEHPSSEQLLAWSSLAPGDSP